jgi:hypothetical protein
MDHIAYTLPEAARIAGVSRTRIFDAVRKQELTIRKAGRASIVTHDDLVAWIKSLPARGKPPKLMPSSRGEADATGSADPAYLAGDSKAEEAKTGAEARHARR